MQVSGSTNVTRLPPLSLKFRLRAALCLGVGQAAEAKSKAEGSQPSAKLEQKAVAVSWNTYLESVIVSALANKSNLGTPP